MPRFATTIRVESADGSTVVDFSGCRGYIEDGLQFLDDRVRESRVSAAEGTPHFQQVDMGSDNPHRGNTFGVSFDAAVATNKLTALIALSAAAKAAQSYMKVFLEDALVTLDGIPSKADPDAQPFWVAAGRESEGFISNVIIRFIAL